MRLIFFCFAELFSVTLFSSKGVYKKGYFFFVALAILIENLHMAGEKNRFRNVVHIKNRPYACRFGCGEAFNHYATRWETHIV